MAALSETGHPQPRRPPPLRRRRLRHQPRRPPRHRFPPGTGCRRDPAVPGSRCHPAPAAPAPRPAAEGDPGSARRRGGRGEEHGRLLEIPTATSVRAIPATLMIDNRIVINNHLKRTRGGKISFTHLLGYAIVQGSSRSQHEPPLRRHRRQAQRGVPAHTNLGLAIDLPGRTASRSLVVAAIKGCETKGFADFVAAYEDIIRARQGRQAHLPRTSPASRSR